MADWLLGVAAEAMTPRAEAVAVHFALEFSLGSLLSLALTVGIGAAVFIYWDPLHRRFDRLLARFDTLSTPAQYERFINGIPVWAARSTRWLQHGELPGYSTLMVGFVTALLAGILLAGWGHWLWPQWVAPSTGFVLACLLIVSGALLAVFQRDRLVLLLCSGLVGYGSAVFFMYTGAPDVAYTQFVVESVFVIVLASVLLKLKLAGRGQGMPKPHTSPWAFPLAVAFGAVVTVIMLVSFSAAFNTQLTDFFAQVSVPEAHGRNVVNVVLVDFRALDTLGEIAVVMLSFLAALPVLHAVRAHMLRQKKSTQEGSKA